jgi:hypothetical protein
MPSSAPARIFPANLMHAVRGTVRFGDVAKAVEIGTIPAGSFVRAVHVHVKTAFNAATTNTMDVGTSGTAAAFAAAASTLVGAAGYKQNLTGTGMGDTLLVDTPVVVRYTATGTAATTGEADILVEYYPQRN